ncbi:MAG: DoxX family protein [Caldilineaceae bacterium]|nr:DoxX family protein [Caldilineaceae bacterium]
MNIFLWILQILLAIAFAAHGILFLAPPPDLLVLMNETLNPNFRIFLGVAEVLAALGLTLPGITRILPWLVPLAASGIIIVMIGATIQHTQRAEYSSAITTAILLVIATFLAYMRWRVKPIQARGQAA